jgi:hypothetical protein
LRNEYPLFVRETESSLRNSISLGQDSTEKNLIEYDAYVKDVATVSIVFKKSSILQLQSQQRMSWIDYFSTVGGLLGLVLGMGIISFVELFWLCLRIFAQKFNMTDWVA